MQIFGAILVQSDADGEALLHFDEVARSIVNGDERVRATGGIGEAENTAFVRDVRDRVHMDRDRGTFVDMRQLRLAVVGFDPEAILIHDADQRLPRIDQFADIDVARAHKTRVRGDDAVRTDEPACLLCCCARARSLLACAKRSRNSLSSMMTSVSPSQTCWYASKRISLIKPCTRVFCGAMYWHTRQDRVRVTRYGSVNR